jgi:hypothetical protein
MGVPASGAQTPEHSTRVAPGAGLHV